MCTAHSHGARVVLNADVGTADWLTDADARAGWVSVAQRSDDRAANSVTAYRRIESFTTSFTACAVLLVHNVCKTCALELFMMGCSLEFSLLAVQVEELLRAAHKHFMDGVNFDLEVPLAVGRP